MWTEDLYIIIEFGYLRMERTSQLISLDLLNNNIIFTSLVVLVSLNYSFLMEDEDD